MPIKKTTKAKAKQPKVKLPTFKELLLAMANAATEKQARICVEVINCNIANDHTQDIMPLYQGDTSCNDCGGNHSVLKFGKQLVAIEINGWDDATLRPVISETKTETTFKIVD